jgi:hypothetical protein
MTYNTTLPARLDADWRRLRTSRRHVAAVQRWSGGDPDDPFDRLVEAVSDLDQIVAATQRGARDDEHILRRLVETARSEELAGRILLQRLLPGLLARSRQYVDRRDPNAGPTDLVVAAAWIAIRRYDTVRRPNQVAAALISDAVFHAFRQPARRRSATELVCSPATFCAVPSPEPDPSPIEEFADVVREAHRAGVADGHLELLRRLVVTGSPEAVGAERKVTARAIRYQRERTVRQVRTAVAA